MEYIFKNSYDEREFSSKTNQAAAKRDAINYAAELAEKSGEPVKVFCVRTDGKWKREETTLYPPVWCERCNQPHRPCERPASYGSVGRSDRNTRIG